MYHEVTNKDRAKKRKRRIMLLVAIVALVAVIFGAFAYASASTQEQGATALRRSILNAANRCCAIEGSYPLTLSKLEEDYGLRVNHKDFVVTYEAYASNMAPSVVVVPR